jgi:8-oxo-dGTP pyrophosphatase MutT (NUDIX family)
VILARSAASEFELFMVRRHARARSFADAYVFPGGVVRADDFADQPGDLTPEGALARFATRGGDPPTDAALALALHRAAVRELFEEAGVLLAVDAAGRPAEIADADRAERGAAGRSWAERRRAVQAGELTMAALLAAEGLSAALGRLRYFSHWITPLGAARRFDTRFFVAEMPPGQRAADCGVETFDGVWLRPREALGRYAAGALPLVFPTRMHLQRLTGPASLSELLELARTKPVATVRPTRPGQEVVATW